MDKRLPPTGVSHEAWSALLECAQDDAPTHAFLALCKNGCMSFPETMVQLAVHQAKRAAELTKIAVDAIAAHTPVLYIKPEELEEATRSRRG